MIRVLTEAEDLTLTYEKEKDLYAKINIIKSYGGELESKYHIPKSTWEKFVEMNPSPLISEFNMFSFSESNPFVNFIVKYYKVNKDLKPFTEVDAPYNKLHNLISKKVITISEFTDSSSFDILYNITFWENRDIEWLVKLWKYLNIEANVDKLYVEGSFLNNHFIQSYSNWNTEDKILTTKKLIFYSDIILNLRNKKKLRKTQISSLEKKLKPIKILNSNVQTEDIISAQFKFLNETSKADSTFIDTRYENKNNITVNKPITRQEINQLRQVFRDTGNYSIIIKTLKELSLNLTSQDWHKVFNILYRAKNNFNQGEFND